MPDENPSLTDFAGAFIPLGQTESFSIKRYQNAQAALSRSNFKIGYRFLKDQSRKDLETLYVFFRVVDDLVDEPYPGEDPKEELSAWTEDLSGGARFDHPLSVRLHELVDRLGVPQEILLDVVRGMATDLDRVRIASMADLRKYCYLAAGAVGRACIPVFGGDLERLAPYADALGEAFQLTNILRDVKEDAARDRIYLPADRMLHYGVSDTDVLSGVLTEGLRELLCELWDISEEDYRKAQILLSTSDDRKVMRPARAMEAYYHEIHREIRRRDFNVFSRPVSLSKFRKASLLLFFLMVGQWAKIPKNSQQTEDSGRRVR